MNDEVFVTQREFDRTVRSLENNIRDGQSRIDGELRRLTDAVKETTHREPPVDHGALVMQRALDMLDKRARGGNSSWLYTAIGALMTVALYLATKGVHW